MKTAFLILTCLHATFRCLAECHTTPQAWLDEIASVESDQTSNVDKIKRLNLLKEEHIRCVGLRDSVYGVLVHRLGNRYMRVNSYDEAIRYTREAVDINSGNTGLAQRPFLAHSYYNLALCYNTMNLQADARQYFDSCISIATQYPEKNFIALLAYEKLAFSLYQSGDYQKAIDNADAGMLLAIDKQDTLSEALMLMQKAQAYLQLNEIELAEKDVTKMVTHLRTGGSEGVSYLPNAYSVYAKLLLKQKKMDQAVSFYRKAYDGNKKNERWEQCSRDLQGLGLLYDQELGDPKNAMKCYREALLFAKQSGNADRLGAIYNNIGMVMWRQKKFRQALDQYQKGLAAITGLSDTASSSVIPLSKLKAASNDNLVYMLLANKGESLLELFRTEGDTTLLQNAKSTFRLTDRMIDHMRWKQVGETSKLYWRNHTRICYENAIEVCYLLGDVDEGFFFFEKSRAVLLNDKLNELGAQKVLSASDLEKERNLRVVKFSYAEQLAGISREDEGYNAARKNVLDAQQALDRFIKGLETTYPGYYRYKYDTIAPSLETFRKNVLQKDVSFLSYFATDASVYILAVMPEKSQFVKVDYPYHAEAVRFLQMCSDKEALNRNYSAYMTLAHKLYNKLIKPLDIPTRRILISQDDHFIPFEALVPDTVERSNFLIHEYAISYTYSASYLMKNAKKNVVDDTWLGVTPVKYSSSLSLLPLPGAEQSLKAIGESFSSADYLVNGNATKEQFLKKLPDYSIVHLYSHANADSERGPVLYFSDSAMHTSDLQTLQGSAGEKECLVSPEALPKPVFPRPSPPCGKLMNWRPIN
jgi:tetratricopeptide (TPR) repeat protein/CHAT domain-containing protein